MVSDNFCRDMEPYIASLPKREGPQVLRVSGNTYALYALRLCLTAFLAWVASTEDEYMAKGYHAWHGFKSFTRERAEKTKIGKVG